MTYSINWSNNELLRLSRLNLFNNWSPFPLPYPLSFSPSSVHLPSLRCPPSFLPPFSLLLLILLPSLPTLPPPVKLILRRVCKCWGKVDPALILGGNPVDTDCQALWDKLLAIPVPWRSLRQTGTVAQCHHHRRFLLCLTCVSTHLFLDLCHPFFVLYFPTPW